MLTAGQVLRTSPDLSQNFVGIEAGARTPVRLEILVGHAIAA